MEKKRKFYAWRTQIYEQMAETPDQDLDTNILISRSRGLAELIASLLTDHFASEATLSDIASLGEKNAFNRPLRK